MGRRGVDSTGGSSEKSASLTFVVAEPNPRSGLNAGELIAAVRGARGDWQGSCSDVELPELVFVPGDERLPIARDGMSVLRARTGTWCPDRAIDDRDCYSRERAAITHRYPSESSGGEGSSFYREADIEINAVHYSWSAQGNSGVPLRPLLVHELGHVFGLAHSCEGSECRGNARARASVMYPDPLENRLASPTNEDCRKLRALYPSQDSAAPAWVWFGLAVPLVFALACIVVFARRRAR